MIQNCMILGRIVSAKTIYQRGTPYTREGLCENEFLMLRTKFNDSNSISYTVFLDISFLSKRVTNREISSKQIHFNIKNSNYKHY